VVRGGRSLLLGETRKRVQGTDSTCPHCGEVEEDLEHVLRMCWNWRAQGEKKFVQVPLPLSVMMTDQAGAVRYFPEVLDRDLPQPPLP
jgi:hypothetical protein